MCCLPDACTHTESRDGNIRYDEYENDNLFPLVEYKTYDPQRGMCFLPRRGLNVAECEIARAFKVAASLIEAIAFIVPRKVRLRTPASLSHTLTHPTPTVGLLPVRHLPPCALCRARTLRGRVL